MVSSLLSSFPAQKRGEFESNAEKEAPPNTGTIKQVKVMVGFWCFNKMFKGIKSRRGCEKVWNLKTACLLHRPLWTVMKGRLPQVAIFRGNKRASSTQYTSPLMLTHPPASPSTPYPSPSEPSASLWAPTTPTPQITASLLLIFLTSQLCLSPCHKMQHYTRSQHYIADFYLSSLSDCMHVNAGRQGQTNQGYA